jgi:hypothetical protein
VSQTNSRTPFVYLYADDEGIESLYAQTTDRVETELTESRSKEGGGEVRIKGKRPVLTPCTKCE